MSLSLSGPRGVAAPALHAAAVPEKIRLALLWLIGFSGGFVFIEPSPYEFVVSFAVVVFAMTGLRLRAQHLPLLIILIIYVIAYAIGVVPVIGTSATVIWTLVSCFMAVSSMFFALALAENTERRLNALLAGYVAGALIVSVIAILAYFHLMPGSESFLYLGRVKATFKDPNVFGPFLILPILILIGRVLAGRDHSTIGTGLMLFVMLLAELLSFSRGAWGHLVGSAALLVIFSFMTAQTAKERLRIMVFVMIGAAICALFLVAVLSIDQVAALFKERASLEQSYDEGPLGRFGRHILGFLLMLDHPFGIGPLQFTKYFPEDPHNSFLDAFMAGGWLGGFAYITLMAVTLAFALRQVFVRAPWQHVYIAIFSTFAVEVGESYIIDVQHWRHFFLLIGLLWGLMAAGRAARSVAPPAPAHYSPRALGA